MRAESLRVCRRGTVLEPNLGEYSIWARKVEAGSDGLLEGVTPWITLQPSKPPRPTVGGTLNPVQMEGLAPAPQLDGKTLDFPCAWDATERMGILKLFGEGVSGQSHPGKSIVEAICCTEIPPIG